MLPAALRGYLRDCRFVDLFALLGLVLYAAGLRDHYFFFDDFYFLDKVAREPALSLLLPQEEFYYRPLSQYGFFGAGTLLFGANATGYYLLNLALLCGVALLAYPVARFAGFTPVEARIGCCLMLLSAPLYRCVSWLSNVQHSLYIFFVLAMVAFEIRWLERRRTRDKLLGIACFGLGLAANVAAAVALPLLGWVHLHDWRAHSFAGTRARARGLLASLVPSALLFGAFFRVFSQTPAYAPVRAGLDDPTHPYFLRISLSQAFDNLGFFGSHLFPYGALTAPLLAGLALFAMLRWLRERPKRGASPSAAGFAAGWAFVAVAPFLFLVNRRDASMALLASAPVFAWFAAWLLSAAGALPARWRLQWLAPILVAVFLGVHAFRLDALLARPGVGGRLQAAGIEQINDLAKGHFPEASTLVLVNRARTRPGAPPGAADWVWTSYGYGRIPPMLVEGRRVEFVTDDVEERLAALAEDEGVIFYRDNFRFFVLDRPPGGR